MIEEKFNSNGKESDTVNTFVDELTLFDDDLMSRVFDKNIEATELILRIILERNITVTSVIGQDELKNHEVGGRNITLDVHAIDEDGEEIDIEVQGNSSGAHIKRARYHSSMVDSRMLAKGQAFKELKDSYVIFIYKHDKFRKGLPVYHIDRYVKETGGLFADGSHIIYVNGNYKGRDEIGQLMQDFHQANPENIHYNVLAQSVKHFKETEKGRGQMSEVLEKYAKIYAEEHAEEYAKEFAEKYAKECVTKEKAASVKNLMENMKLTLEQALNALGIQGDEREVIIKKLMK